jgi:hypothetical protein
LMGAFATAVSFNLNTACRSSSWWISSPTCVSSRADGRGISRSRRIVGHRHGLRQGVHRW